MKHVLIALRVILTWPCLNTGMRSPGRSPTKQNCYKMDWSEQAEGIWLRRYIAFTGDTRSWAAGWSCPLPSLFLLLCTRPSITKRGSGGLMISIVDTHTANNLKLKLMWLTTLVLCVTLFRCQIKKIFYFHSFIHLNRVTSLISQPNSHRPICTDQSDFLNKGCMRQHWARAEKRGCFHN